MGRSYLTVRALVLTVTLLVILEYFSLMQSAENADKRGAPVIFRLCEGEGAGVGRHLLQAVEPGLYSARPALATAAVRPARPAPALSRTNTTAQLPVCPIIPPSLHGRSAQHRPCYLEAPAYWCCAGSR